MPIDKFGRDVSRSNKHLHQHIKTYIKKEIQKTGVTSTISKQIIQDEVMKFSTNIITKQTDIENKVNALKLNVDQQYLSALQYCTKDFVQKQFDQNKIDNSKEFVKNDSLAKTVQQLIHDLDTKIKDSAQQLKVDTSKEFVKNDTLTKTIQQLNHDLDMNIKDNAQQLKTKCLQLIDLPFHKKEITNDLTDIVNTKIQNLCAGEILYQILESLRAQRFYNIVSHTQKNFIPILRDCRILYFSCDNSAIKIYHNTPKKLSSQPFSIKDTINLKLNKGDSLQFEVDKNFPILTLVIILEYHIWVEGSADIITSLASFNRYP